MIVFPVVGQQASEMNVIRVLGIYNNMPGMFFLKFGFANTYFLLLLATLKSIPKDYREASKIDGANEITIMIRIILPMIRNMLGLIFLIQFIAFWNDYSTTILYMPKRPTIAQGLILFNKSTSGPIADAPFKLGASFLVALPVLILFLCFSEKLMGNVSAGGIKG